MTREPDRARRRAARMLCVGATLSAALGPQAGAQERGRDDGFDLGRDVRLFLIDPQRGRFAPKTLTLRTRTDALTARLPSWAEFEAVNRFDTRKIPQVGGFLGGLQGPRPAASFLDPAHRLGALLRQGDAVTADVAEAFETSRTPALATLSAASIWVLTKIRRYGVVELGARATFKPVARPPQTASAGDVIGDLYAAEGRLLLAPPREALFGTRLL